MWKTRIIAIVVLAIGVLAGWSVYDGQQTGERPFQLGLDLSGGSYLVYEADVSNIPEAEVDDVMASLREVIQRRVNTFGVSEPNVQAEKHSIGVEGTQQRLIVELPGVTDLEEAKELIGQTPLLEFKTEVSEERLSELEEAFEEEVATQTLTLGEDGTLASDSNEPISITVNQEELERFQDLRYRSTDLTGKYLKRASLQFIQGGIANGGGLQSQTVVQLTFDNEGSDLFEQITSENIGKTIAIYLDGKLESAPVVNDVITGGQATISGNFTPQEAKELVAKLNAGALPIPISFLSSETIGPSLGAEAMDAGLEAGIIGLVIVSLLLIVWYRLPGLISVVALAMYTAFVLYLFTLIPVTLTAAGIAGFIISIGLAVDANILIFERLKEEIQKGAGIREALVTGFKRAWASIRDANVSSIISAFILFWFGTPLIKGFALTFGIGILVSMLTAVVVTRLLILSVAPKDQTGKQWFLSGFSSTNKHK